MVLIRGTKVYFLGTGGGEYFGGNCPSESVSTFLDDVSHACKFILETGAKNVAGTFM